MISIFGLWRSTRAFLAFEVELSVKIEVPSEFSIESFAERVLLYCFLRIDRPWILVKFSGFLRIKSNYNPF